MATVIDELMIRLGFITDTSGAGRMESAMGGIMGKAGALFAALGGLAGALDVAKTSDELSLLEGRFTNLLGSQEKAREANDKIYESAQRLGAGYTESAAATAKMLVPLQGQGKGIDEAIKMQEVLAVTARLGGASTQEAASSALQFAQALGSGTLAGDEFKSIAEANVPLLNILAKSMGVTRGELKKLGSDGKITSDQMTKAILDNYQDIMDQSKKLGTTFDIQWTRIKNQYTRFIDIVNRRNIFKGLHDSIDTVSNRIERWIDESSSGFIDSIERIQQRLSEGWKVLKMFGDKIGIVGHMSEISAGFVGLLAANLTGLAAMGAIRTLITGFSMLLSPLALIGGAILAIGLLIDDYLTYREGGDSVIGEILRQYPGLVTLKDNVIALVDTIQDRWKSFSMAAAIIFAPWIAQFILLQTQAALAFGRMLWTAAVNFISMSAMSVVSTGLMIANTYRMAVVWIARMVSMASAALLPFLPMIVGISLVLAAAYLLWSNWETIWEGISNVVGGTIESILINWDSMVSSMTAAWDNAVSWVSAKLEPIFGVIEKIRSAWSSVFSGGDVAMPMPAGAMGGGKVGGQTTVNNSTTVNVPSPAAAAQVVNQTNNNAAAQAQKAATGAKRQ